MAMFFKRGTLFFLIIIPIALTTLGVKWFIQNFHLRTVLVSGNYHLDEKDIVESSGIRKGESLMDIRFSVIDKKLKENAWIREVALRKQFPGTLVIKVEEAVPKVLLRSKKRLYLLSGDGKILERIKGDLTPFLPVIKDISIKNTKGIREAIKLVDALSKKNVLDHRETIEIGLESYGLKVNIDGELIKVGYGNYAAKFDRWVELEPEIREKGMPIQYVDLRFKDSVIVKPLKPGKRRSSS
jgi:cell division septal protein FtsQ